MDTCVHGVVHGLGGSGYPYTKLLPGVLHVVSFINIIKFETFKVPTLSWKLMQTYVVRTRY